MQFVGKERDVMRKRNCIDKCTTMFDNSCDFKRE